MSLHCSKNEPALGFQLLLFFSQTRFSWTSCVLQHRLHCWCSGDARRWGKGKRFVSFSQLVITSIMQKTLWSTLSKESLHILTFLARSFRKQFFSPSREITCVISCLSMKFALLLIQRTQSFRFVCHMPWFMTWHLQYIFQPWNQQFLLMIS